MTFADLDWPHVPSATGGRYVVVTCGNQVLKSTVKPKTLNPVWNEDMELSGTLRDFLRDGLQLEIFDQDNPARPDKDDSLGELSLRYTPRRRRVELCSKRVPCATVGARGRVRVLSCVPRVCPACRSLGELRSVDALELTEPLPTKGKLAFGVVWEPIAQAPPPPDPNAVKRRTRRIRIRVGDRPLLVRAGVELDSPLVGQLLPGAIVTVIEERVTAGDVRACIALDHFDKEVRPSHR